MIRPILTLPLVALCLAVPAASLAAEGSSTRVKDIATLQGIPSTPLIGYGLVVGLNKTGDRRQTYFPAQTLANMLERLGLDVGSPAMRVENIAAVLVTAELPSFARPGARLDVTVSSVGDARSLQGGTLTATALRGVDGRVQALAQGPLSLGGFGVGRAGNAVAVNHLTAGRVPGGGIVQVPAQATMPSGGQILLALREPDFMTARRLAETINADLGSGVAHPVDPATVALDVPAAYHGAVPDLMARIEPLPVEVDAPARVVINERTGTVVVGANVRIRAAAVAHGNLSVRISTRYDVSQPAPFSDRGDTVVVPDQRIEVDEGTMQLVALDEGATLQDVVRALNALGATPRDIIAIMQALKVAGALRAELVIL
jgi:flagellar P-ring protein precursor FlgI